ncbi:hypothetical protein BN1048_00634 [Jeotgalicoccus saudimassiliensis]|uniref:Uncharacterized protein n=1 Tax=Jeotgalicoccus saudimassiliensis TaxID=1461582 RepID=A0A078M3E8_9STAP|nr:hypothetical protein [Jeotgalicoccus saudimassiliensis]CDZ99747.1 hypothetical protein BN1048_00634 [Jeotgalicoccus saudimassiliensis]
MTMKDFKTLTGLFAVMLSFGLLYSFNMVEPDYAENVHSHEETAFSENSNDESDEHESNITVSAASINEQEESDENSLEENGAAPGFISSGMLTKQLNYEVSSRN